MSWPFVDFQVNTISKRKKKTLNFPRYQIEFPLELIK